MTKQRGWKDVPTAGVCWVPATEYITGDWRTFKPTLEQAKCNKCLMCYIYCPDGAVEWRPEVGEIEFNYKYCKGCGICANECRQEAIKMVLE